METLTERQQQLLGYLLTYRSITMDSIRKNFGISAATAYRDVQALVQAGMAVKIIGGVKLYLATNTAPEPTGNCSFCGKVISKRTLFVIQMQDGSQRNACCPHCGMMALGQPGVLSALAVDFLYERLINVRQAAFLLESSVNVCCQPSVICFSNEKDAQGFQMGFGGRICNLDQAIAGVTDLMLLNPIIPLADIR